jgi:hypothetical protein
MLVLGLGLGIDVAFVILAACVRAYAGAICDLVNGG